MQGVGLIDNNYNVYDGTDDTKGCTSVDHDQWSYNVGIYLYGSAVMQALTNDPKWVTRTNGQLAATGTFFQMMSWLRSASRRAPATSTISDSRHIYHAGWLLHLRSYLRRQGLLCPCSRLRPAVLWPCVLMVRGRLLVTPRFTDS